jgi:hypothetical protein
MFKAFGSIKEWGKDIGIDRIPFIFKLYQRIKMFFLIRKLKVLFKGFDLLNKGRSSDKKPKIIFHLIRPLGGNPILYFETILAHALNLRGADSKLLVCDGVLSTCDGGTYIRDQRMYYCDSCTLYSGKLLSSMKVAVIKYSEFITPGEISAIEKEMESFDLNPKGKLFKDRVDIGNFARSSTIRYFLRGIHEDSDEFKRIYREKVKCALIVLKVAQNVYENEKPDVIVTLHGIYSPWGPMYEYFKQKGISVIVYGKGTETNLFLFNENGREFENIGNIFWEKLKTRNLTDKENRELDEYLSQRFGGGGDLKMYHEKLNVKKERHELRKIINLKSRYKKVFAMFTNLPWDAALMGFDTIFKDAFEWVRQTTRYFIDKPDYLLIIKVHPAEKVWEKGTYSFQEFIRNNFPDLPENIIILPPDTAISPYDLFSVIDLGLVYNGTLGLEMAVKGVPVLAAGKAHYLDKEGIVYKLKDTTEYFKMLEDHVVLNNNLNIFQNNARKYAYLLFIKAMIPISFFDEENWFHVKWEKLNNFKDLVASDKQLNNICDCIMNNKEILRV